MTDDKATINQMKSDERLKIDIPVEEEAGSGKSAASTDVVEEFKKLGRQFADTLEGISTARKRVAWRTKCAPA